MLDYRSQIENLTYINHVRDLYCDMYKERISLNKCKICRHHKGITVTGDVYCSR